MKIHSIKILVLCALYFLVGRSDIFAQSIDPKVKMVATMAVYGTVGGALLGTASLAFDTPGRSVAQGASLGLYAGLLFGGYIVLSHSMRSMRYEQGPTEDYNNLNPVDQGPTWRTLPMPTEGDEEHAPTLGPGFTWAMPVLHWRF